MLQLKLDIKCITYISLCVRFIESCLIGNLVRDYFTRFLSISVTNILQSFKEQYLAEEKKKQFVY